ncbi:MAG: Mitochondrial translocator assembly and maintenance protein 41 [Vezdaea aestivalis]|nr:MAG: Mitochondrial translocator assembly and maintenance protein 41 [Vezdaea aestivalis]
MASLRYTSQTFVSSAARARRKAAPLVFVPFVCSYATTSKTTAENSKASSASTSPTTSTPPRASSDGSSISSRSSSTDWADNPDFNISKFSELPSTNFGYNQHMLINDEFKEALRQILWTFKAPIRYAFAYGSGVFQQGTGSPSSSKPIHPSPSPAIAKAQQGENKMIDMIFGVSYTQHWHSLNLQQHRDHYSALGSLGSGVVSRVQDRYGAGVYFHPYINVNGTLIKYGVVNLDTLCKDLSEWQTLYLAGRLHKPVKILRDDPRVRLANQINLLSAVRTALLLLPETFSELQLYGTIAGISYMGDLRMSLPTENPHKVSNIVSNQLPHFRRLYAPLIENLPNVDFKDHRCSNPDWVADPSANVQLAQDLDPVKRGNMVRRLPKEFRQKLYFRYQEKFQIPRNEFLKMMDDSTDEDATRIKRREGGPFEQQVANDSEGIEENIRLVTRKTIGWPSTAQSIKSIATAGLSRTWRYVSEKLEKGREARKSKPLLREKQQAAQAIEENSSDRQK